MPRTILDKPKPFDKLVALIRGTADVQGKDFTDMGNMVGCTSQTIAVRIKHPEKITLGELVRMGRGLNIPIEDLRQCIKY